MSAFVNKNCSEVVQFCSNELTSNKSCNSIYFMKQRTIFIVHVVVIIYYHMDNKNSPLFHDYYHMDNKNSPLFHDYYHMDNKNSPPCFMIQNSRYSFSIYCLVHY
jgi:hypothetical protein